MSENQRNRLKALENLLYRSEDSGGWSTTELAKELGVTDRTILDDIYRLRSENIDVCETPGKGKNKRYFLEGRRAILKLTIPQVWMLYLPLRRLQRAGLQRIPMIRSLVREIVTHIANEEIANTLAELQKVETTQDAYLSPLFDGWKQNKWVYVEYQRPNASASKRYKIAPYWFEPAVWTDGFYVIAGMARGESIETVVFKMDRFRDAALTPESFEKPQREQLLKGIEMSWGIWGSEDQTTQLVKLKFTNRHYQRLMETQWHPSQKITLDMKGDIIWEVMIAEPQEMMPWIRSWGADVEVIEPYDLRQQIALEAQATLRLYDVDESNEHGLSFF